MNDENEIKWLKDAVKINKLRINEIYNGVEYCESHRIINITKTLLDKSQQSLKSARHALLLTDKSALIDKSINVSKDKDRITKISGILDGISKTIYTPEGKKSAYEYASMTNVLIQEILDIACRSYENLLNNATAITCQ